MSVDEQEEEEEEAREERRQRGESVCVRAPRDREVGQRRWSQMREREEREEKRA